MQITLIQYVRTPSASAIAAQGVRTIIIQISELFVLFYIFRSFSEGISQNTPLAFRILGLQLHLRFRCIPYTPSTMLCMTTEYNQKTSACYAAAQCLRFPPKEVYKVSGQPHAIASPRTIDTKYVRLLTCAPGWLDGVAEGAETAKVC